MSDTTHELTTDQAEREASGAHAYGRYLEEFEVGAVYKHWPAKTVTESDDHLFCLITMNHHPLHLNDVYACSPSRARTSSSARSSTRWRSACRSRDVSGKAIANLATEELSHPNPVFHGDTLFCETEVLDVKPSKSKPDRGIVKVHTRVSTRTASWSPSSSDSSWSPARTRASPPRPRTRSTRRTRFYHGTYTPPGIIRGLRWGEGKLGVRAALLAVAVCPLVALAVSGGAVGAGPDASPGFAMRSLPITPRDKAKARRLDQRALAPDDDRLRARRQDVRRRVGGPGQGLRLAERSRPPGSQGRGRHHRRRPLER